MTDKKGAADGGKEYVRRFGLQFIIQHLVMFTSVILLVLTGIPLWRIDFHGGLWWDQAFLKSADFLQLMSSIHHMAGVMLIAVSVYHLLYTILSREGRREFVALLPTPKDFTDVAENMMYFVGRRKDPPRFGRFTYYEKFDYWAVYWGCVIMIGSGLALWYPRLTAQYAPWMNYDLAALIHADEALLAGLALFVWHFYNVHYNPAKFPGSLMWLHGKIEKEELKDFHRLEYDAMFPEEMEPEPKKKAKTKVKAKK